MALRREIARIEMSNAGTAILRIRAEDRVRLEKQLFRRYPHREWGTFFQFGWRRTSWGLAISFIEGLWPNAGDLDRQTDLTTFKDQYSLRAFQAAEDIKPLAIGVLHSHPCGFSTQPSALDDDMDTYFAREFAARSGGAPYCSLIFQRSKESGLTFSGRVYDRGEWLSLATMLTVGNVIERHSSELIREGDFLEPNNSSITSRLKALMGLPSAKRLRRSIVGIIGCSGTGSPAAHVLARARVGEFVLVDPERLSSSNLERLHGSYERHLSTLPYKVEVVRQLIHQINPDALVTGLVGNILHENVIDELLRCDMVLGCMDSVHGRVALSDFSQHFLLPSLDIGVAMDGTNGKVTEQVIEFTQYSPGLPCAYCGQRVNSAQLNYELMTDEERARREEQAELASARGDDADQYWHGRPRQLPTVGYLTSCAGSMAAGYVEGTLTGAFAIPHTTMQFDCGKYRLGCVAPPREQNSNCSCEKHLGWGEGARSYRNVALPPHWGKRAMVLFRGPGQQNFQTSGPSEKA